MGTADYEVRSFLFVFREEWVDLLNTRVARCWTLLGFSEAKRDGGDPAEPAVHRVGDDSIPGCRRDLFSVKPSHWLPEIYQDFVGIFSEIF